MSEPIRVSLAVPMKGKKLREIEALASSEDASFIVHKSQLKSGDGSTWVITHRASGFCVPRLAYETAELALADADKFNAVPGLGAITAKDRFTTPDIPPALRTELRKLLDQLEWGVDA